MREAWRTVKAPLYAAVPADTQLQLFLIFTTAEMPTQAIVTAAITKTVARLVQQLPTSPDA